MKLHHVGIVVPSIDDRLRSYQELYRLALVRPKTHDPLQDVYVAFLQSEDTKTLLELIEPASSASPVIGALKRGGGLNHLCYSVPNLKLALEDLVAKGSVIVRPATPAVAFNGRHIAFVYTRLRELVELVEEH